MTELCLIFLIVLVSDQGIKLLLRRCLGPRALPLGPFGSLRIVSGRLWLRRLGRQPSHDGVWRLWVVAAVPFVLVSAAIPSSTIFVGLLLGGPSAMLWRHLYAALSAIMSACGSGQRSTWPMWLSPPE